MKIGDILSPEFILPDLKARKKEDALKELCEFLKAKGAIRDTEALFQSLLERERLGSTGIGENVAIPHAKTEELDRILTVFGKSQQGLDFESLDQKPVHFICLLLAPASSTGLHLKALARISRLLKSQTLRDAVLKAGDPETIFSIFQDEDSKFI